MRLLILTILLPISVICQSNYNLSLLGTYDNYNSEGNDIWGWVAPDGSEYALVGLNDGFSVVNVTNPSNPVEEFFINDLNSTWRDVKTWGHYAYVTTEADAGLLIVDLSDMTGNTYYHRTLFSAATTGADTEFTAAHNIYIDENGVAYIFGASSNTGSSPSDGVIFLDVDTDPINPLFLGEWDDFYVHDGMARGDTMYVGCIYEGDLYVVDVSNKSNPVNLGNVGTPSDFTHNAWVSDNGNYIFTTDEVSDAYIGSYDISNLNNIQEIDRIQSNPGSNSIPHNAHVDGNFLITSYYTNGTVVHDITYPDNMVEVGYYDSYLGSGWGFDGCWGTYPYLPSGNIISSDINSGSSGGGKLFIYNREFQQACYLEGYITDQSNGNQIANANISILNTNFTSLSNLNGYYQISALDSGNYQVVCSAFGYANDTSTILLNNGVISNLDISLDPTCSFPKPDSLYVYDIIDSRVKIGWKNMNSSECRVLKYFVRFREVGTPNWITRSAGAGSGLCNFGLNTTTKQLINLSPGTTYEIKMKAFYCGGGSSGYSSPIQFTTSDTCPSMIGLTATTFNFQPGKVRFDWDLFDPYIFARVKYRVDTSGSLWQNVGGFGIYYPLSSINAFGLLSGVSYRGHGRLFCDSNITAYRSPSWTNPPIFWSQPNPPIKLGSNSDLYNFNITPNPSNGNFNIEYNLDFQTDLVIKIFNTIGEKVYENTCKSCIGELNLSYNLKELESSVYFVSIDNGITIKTKKIIIE